MIFPFNKIKLKLRTQWWINKCQLKRFIIRRDYMCSSGKNSDVSQHSVVSYYERALPFFLATNSHHPLVLYCTRRFFGGPSRKREKVRRASLTLSNDVINPNKKMLYSSTGRSSSSFSSYFPWITNLQKMLYLTTHVIVSRYLKHWDYKCKSLVVTCKVFS